MQRHRRTGHRTPGLRRRGGRDRRPRWSATRWCRIGSFGPRATAALIAGAARRTVYIVPFLKYPANPPAVGNPDTIGKRTTLFFLMVALSLLLAVAAVIIGKAARTGPGQLERDDRSGHRVRPGDRPRLRLPALVRRGRQGLPGQPAGGSSGSPRFAVQSTFWAGFGLVFGYLADRLLLSSFDGADTPRVATPVG
ncbi:Membrane protein OS=Streptomyces microflavus OX=1919 GN=Smic_74880 PE=4 SV=1 [Streptomyces microflavus]